MTFTSHPSRRDISTKPPPPLLNMNTVSVMPFSKRKFSSSTLSASTHRIVTPNAETVPRQISSYIGNSNNNNNESKMVWGNPTWTLFHMIAEKFQENMFQEKRNEILQLIYTICINLPCPTCAEHAKSYIIKTGFLRIQSQEELKLKLFQFHNQVNVRKGYPQMAAPDLDQLYMKAVPAIVIKSFIDVFNRKNKNIRLLADDLHRQQITSNLIQWFNQNIGYFDPPVTPLP